MQLDTTTTIGKQMLAMVLSASTANMPITLLLTCIVWGAFGTLEDAFQLFVFLQIPLQSV